MDRKALLSSNIHPYKPSIFSENSNCRKTYCFMPDALSISGILQVIAHNLNIF